MRYWFSAVQSFCLLGVLISVYALYVEISGERNKDYKALCDISEHMSCSAVLNSKWDHRYSQCITELSRYGRGLGVMIDSDRFGILAQRNSIYGILFYSTLAILGLYSLIVVNCFMYISDWFRHPLALKCSVLLSLLSLLGSVYLSYILFYILKDICLVCISIYFVNFVLFTLTVRRAVRQLTPKKNDWLLYFIVLLGFILWDLIW